MTGYKPLQCILACNKMFRCIEDDNNAKANVADWLVNLFLLDCIVTVI